MSVIYSVLCTLGVFFIIYILCFLSFKYPVGMQYFWMYLMLIVVFVGIANTFYFYVFN